MASATQQAREASAAPAAARPVRAYALGLRSRLALAQGGTAEALAASDEAMGLLVGLGGTVEGDAAVRLARAEALRASGDEAAAAAVIDEAARRLRDRAAAIKDDAWRESFLARVPEHARILALASGARQKARQDL